MVMLRTRDRDSSIELNNVRCHDYLTAGSRTTPSDLAYRCRRFPLWLTKNLAVPLELVLSYVETCRSKGQKVSEELAFKKAQFAIEQAGAKRNVLVAYTKGKTIKELRSEVEKAHTAEQAKQAAWTLEKAREIELERQLRLGAN